MRLVAPETITFTQSGFCPGCGHGLAVRLIAEVMEEMGLSEKLLAIVDVACGSLNIDSWRFDTIMAAHGRPIATAVGVKKVRPENPVMAYIGDGAAYSIGMAETMHTAIRNDNVVTVVINNSLYRLLCQDRSQHPLREEKIRKKPECHSVWKKPLQDLILHTSQEAPWQMPKE